MVSLPTDVHLMAQMLLYFAAALAGLIFALPLGIAQGNFSGNCLLYSKLDWVNASYATIHFGASTSCQFTMYSGFITCSCYGLALGAYYAYAVFKNRTNRDIAYEMWVMPFLLSNSLILFVVFVTSCVISVGFKTWCDQVMSGKSKGSKLQNCAAMEGAHIDKGHEHFKLGDYYNLVSVAQVAAWFAALFWVCQLALGFLRLYRIRKRRSRDSFQGISDTEVLGDPVA